MQSHMQIFLLYYFRQLPKKIPKLREKQRIHRLILSFKDKVIQIPKHLDLLFLHTQICDVVILVFVYEFFELVGEPEENLGLILRRAVFVKIIQIFHQFQQV